MIKPKRFGGIGIGSIKDFNIAMLSKWWWRLKDNPNQLWVEVVKAIHDSDSNDKMIPVKKYLPGTWKDIGEVDKILGKMGVQIREKFTVKIGNGDHVSFWKDIWVMDQPLKDRFPRLFHLAANKSSSVASCFSSLSGEALWAWDWAKSPANDEEWIQLDELMHILDRIKLSDQKDVWKWENDSDFDFSVKDIRREIGTREEGTTGDVMNCWNAWAPPKCNMLTWQAMMGKWLLKRNSLLEGFRFPGSFATGVGLTWRTRTTFL
ncbi:hypothetical protein HanRHA438_Chr13g0581371 [Helianthus annuus]|uniref:Reverse transcriptase zinc-binding domain-containing protein n=1 Tax=Helianthus annuus TaxID=4232 RepID=A0A9K3H8R2_HELAN|nr:hypothetical protein HanXRQr2_Chr13g0570111 [Helianthus annuus]KAJ0479526.1 hypothetical protein HanIR_Chr13g0620981 [Helianthus annuus]KAJ0847756.1 hypothetical protein HanPSC8_Chr13g0548941 [Helianthus annuus]KAJ0856698.1 hypothetical protein HanRHA438_Chr13g0581371 [Helianthus annuus]